MTIIVAINGLGRIGRAILKLLVGGHPQTRDRALATLGHFGADPSVPSIRRADFYRL